jgi:lipopolysaccharide/colanic/teichoic acid biosynthesis glycosyltransferase
MYRNYFKRTLDLVLSTLIFVCLLPIFISVAIALFIANKGSVFFIQRRPGIHEKIFYVVKFKTMSNKVDKDGELLPDSVRLTGVGRFIRKTSLDEIPQLLNVIKGDMSLIGPRPLLERYLPYYLEKERVRHSVRPGITGWAQVNGRNFIDWKERFEFDKYYVGNLSFRLDCLIILKTINTILTSKGLIIDPGSVLENLDSQRKISK